VTVYSPETRQLKQIAAPAGSPQWLPDSKHVALFDQQNIAILDLDSMGVTSTPFTPPAGVSLPDTVHFSRDGSMLYVVQDLEQGDIWIMRPGTE